MESIGNLLKGGSGVVGAAGFVGTAGGACGFGVCGFGESDCGPEVGCVMSASGLWTECLESLGFDNYQQFATPGKFTWI